MRLWVILTENYWCIFNCIRRLTLCCTQNSRSRGILHYKKSQKKNRTELNGRRKIRHESFICSRITRLIWEKCFDFYYSIRSIFSTILYNIFSKRTKNVEWYKQTKSIIMEYVAEYLSGNSVNPQSNGKKVNRYGSSIDRKTTTTTTTTLRFGGTNEK